MKKEALREALSVLGKKGYRKLKSITTEEQRQAWRKKGGAATRKKFKQINLLKKA